jgi:hypothetical protein
MALEIGQAHTLRRSTATGRELRLEARRLLVLIRGELFGLDGSREEWLSRENAGQQKQK